MKITARLKGMITSKYVVSGTFLASMAESTVVPIPLEVVLIPAMQANRERIWLLAGAALAGCVAGALLGYAVGYGLMGLLGEHLIALFGDEQQYHEALEQMRRHGFWFVLSVGLVPIPFQIAMLAAGAVHYSLIGYVAATLISRGIRYYGLAVLVWKFGNRAQSLVQRHQRATLWGVTALVVTGWLLTWISGA